MSQIYIALDLETTGFDPVADQVLEIAAIKFQDNQIVEKFETLINPNIEIPSMVSHITGIFNDTIKDAPSFDQVSSNLAKFIGTYPIVGHNIEFDLNFLEAKGIPILNPQIDTLKLASILLPNLPSLSLDTISRLLKITHQNKHRAMSDAHVCFELFQILVKKIADIPAPILQEIKTLVPRSTWDLSELFLSIKSENPHRASRLKTPAEPTPPLDLGKQLSNQEDLIDLLSANSPLSKILEHYEHRPGQQKLLSKILSAIEDNHNLIAEAGTGTGKTLAYLLSAAFSKQKSDKKSIISTYTNNLQDQIINKDFPLVQSLFPDIKIAVLKGRKKYLSLERFNQLKTKHHLEEHELTTIIKVLLWLDTTETGDLDQLSLQNKEILLYDEICSDPEHLPKKKSSQYEDFLDKARRKAETADIIIANHALLIQDNLSENHILPDAEILIVDEAHHLEKTVTDALTVVLGLTKLNKLWEKTIDQLQEIQGSNLLFDQDFTNLLEEFGKLKINSINSAEKIFDQISLTIEKFSHTPPGLPSTVNITPSITDSPSWQNTVENAKQFTTLLPELNSLSKKTIQLLNDSDIKENDAISSLQSLQKFHQETENYLNNPGKRITWISKGFDESIHWHFAPLTVQDIFSEKIFSKRQSVILTSATLSTYGNFSYIRSELGLGEDFNEIKIPSHFSYPDQVKIIIPEDLSDPRAPEYLPQCENIIDSVIRKNGGRTLVLFTAKKDLARVFHDLAPQLKTDGFSLLGQNISGGRGKIISHFQDEPEKCAILGTNSFWEGVDMVGDTLTCVVIQKLPFDPPDDPIISARSGRFEKPFEQYSLPRAILRFKQGFGRLIRSSKDTGAVIILDSRLVQKSYGREFTSSLPEGIQIHQCIQKEVANHL
jgi:DNA polymerase-3 subunit epsilon/ATP-dependent DNA helicase DinG